MKELNVPQSGKWGDHVVRRNHYGQYVCKYSPPQKRRTADKGDVESDFQKVSEAWEDLPDEKRPAWSIGATRVRSRARLGKTSALDARALFFKLNLAQLRMGLEVLTDFPGRADFGPNPVGLLTITWAGGRPVLKVRVSGVPAEPIKVYGSPPQNRAKLRCWDLRVLGWLPTPAGGESEITELYFKKYGAPPAGKRVFIGTTQQSNGWQGRQAATNAVVPDRKQAGRNGRHRGGPASMTGI
jgi:hypothetical protein